MAHELKINISMDEHHSALQASVEKFLGERDETLSQLGKLRRDVQEHCVNMKKVTITGSAVSLGATVIAITGLFLAPVTLGGSLALTAVGAAAAVGGGVTGIAANASDKVKRTQAVKSAQQALERDKDAQIKMEKMSKRVQKLRLTENPNAQNDRMSTKFVVPVLDTFRGVGGAAVGIGRVGIATAGTAAKVLISGVGVGVSVLTVPLDIFTIVSAAKKIEEYSNGAKCDAAEYIGKLIETLQVHREKVEAFYRQLKAGAYAYTDKPACTYGE